MLTIRDHRPVHRARWTADAVNYYDTSDTSSSGQQSEPVHHVATGFSMSIAELDAWLLRGELARGRQQHCQRVTYTWHELTRQPGQPRRYRAVVLYWGRWDVARSWHYDAAHPRELYHELCRRDVLRTASDDSDAYATWLMVGRVG